jgi:flagellar basal-body rod protein FlgF
MRLAVQAMHNDQARLEGVSRNLANVATPGYRRETFVTRTFGDALAAAGVQSVMDTRPGSFRPTGRALDVAIEGDGFFEVATANGPAYTRQGSFQVDARGRLVTEAGDAVMGVGGEISGTGAPLSIDRQGQVMDGTRVAGQLKVVRLPRAAQLERLGGGLLRPASGAAPEATPAALRPGHLEASNVSTMNEMVRLIETMRHFEASQRIVQASDDMLEKALRKLGEL